MRVIQAEVLLQLAHIVSFLPVLVQLVSSRLHSALCMSVSRKTSRGWNESMSASYSSPVCYISQPAAAAGHKRKQELCPMQHKELCLKEPARALPHTAGKMLALHSEYGTIKVNPYLACSCKMLWSCCASQAEWEAKRAALELPWASCHMSSPLAMVPVALS